MKKRKKNNYKKRKKIIYNKKRKRKSFSINGIVLVVLLIIVTILCLEYINTTQDNTNHEQYINSQEKLSEEKATAETQTTLLYNNCLNEKFNDNDLDQTINNKIDDINNYLSSYRLSVTYYDPVMKYNFTYNPDMVFYAASTIKMLDAIYIYEKAASGTINLDDTLTYQKSNVLAASAMMKNYNVGDKVSIRDLVKFAIMVSDNSAHNMLINYIGYNNLKNFGLSLGAEYTLDGSDNFGTINTSDSIIYLTELNKFINNNGTLGSELQSYFINSDQNYLKIDDLNINAAEKYGQYSNYYHENGIVYASHPYYISILTTEGNNDYETIIKTINMKIYELHNLYYSERQSRCNLEYYPN